MRWWPMTAKELQTKTLAGVDEILGYRVLVRGEQRRLLRAQRCFWEEATGPVLDELLVCYEATPKGEADEPT